MKFNADDLRERRRIIIEERRRQTYSGHALDHEIEMGGRFAKIQPTTVIGATGVAYPQMDSGPWAKNELPDEPPTGLDVNAQELCGEPWEVEASRVSGPASKSEVSLVPPTQKDDVGAGGGGLR